ncbi:hypothetical protein FOL46_006131 [Perkinsus olseni]|uniref:Uncharacterized protein n=1 Tax=Perkinsus olseni TaxID=32597 RepID=A0A7J6MQQ1_PEROL|nr:hypothetical protein FOL46_006131 [Perkinsus olseni]
MVRIPLMHKSGPVALVALAPRTAAPPSFSIMEYSSQPSPLRPPKLELNPLLLNSTNEAWGSFLVHKID